MKVLFRWVGEDIFSGPTHVNVEINTDRVGLSTIHMEPVNAEPSVWHIINCTPRHLRPLSQETFCWSNKGWSKLGVCHMMAPHCPLVVHTGSLQSTHSQWLLLSVTLPRSLMALHWACPLLHIYIRILVAELTTKPLQPTSTGCTSTSQPRFSA